MKKKIAFVLFFFVLSLNLYSHRLDSVAIDIHFKKDGTYEITAFIHIPHLLSLTTPFNFKKYNDRYEKLIALPNDQFLKLLEKNKLVILNKFEFTFDGETPKSKISFLLKDREPIELLLTGHEKSYLDKRAYCQLTITGTYPKFTRILHWKNKWQNKTHFLKLIMDGELQASKTKIKLEQNNEDNSEDDSALATTFVEESSEKDIDLTNLPTSTWDVFKQFTKLGFTHIIPEGSKGYDHILFVLCLFLSFITWPGFLKQITAFTIAHTITLGLSLYQFISLPSSIIEPLIALSIIVVAVENYFKKEVSHSRLYIVFGFGLMHGFGFAGFVKELLLPPGKTLMSLFSFNIGVEIGQLAVILLAWVIFGAWFRKKDWYHIKLVKPASLAIATFAIYLLIDRLPTF